MKFSGKMCLKIMLKVTKKQNFTLSLEDTFFEKPQGGPIETPSHPLHPHPSRFRIKRLSQTKKNVFYLGFLSQAPTN